MPTSGRTGITVFALTLAGAAFALAPSEALARDDITGWPCARGEIVATGSSRVAPRLAKTDAEIAWEIAVVRKYGLRWYSWWAARNNRFACRTRGRRTVCVARGTPCRIP